MTDPAMQQQLTIFFTRLARRVIEVAEVVAVGGGSIQPTYRATLADGTPLFVKAGTPDQMGRLRAESRGLETLGRVGALRVPEVLLLGGEGRHSYLVLEHLDLVPGAAGDFSRMGRALAKLHRAGAARFGFERDNFIGATPQQNSQTDLWPAFFRDQRLGPQLGQAAAGPAAGAWLDDALRIGDSIDGFFPGYQPQPALLHGDLWRGNAGFLKDGTPVIYDPAVYFGDREADLAMSEMFGGFAPEFAAAYREAWPLDPGYAVRRDLYNLYHMLNHVNLFGAGYVPQAHGLIKRLLSEIR